MATPEELSAEASNPATDPARLATLAHEHPWTGAIVAGNPAAYDGLLDWLTQYGDAAAKAAVVARRNPAPVGYPVPVAPVGYPAPGQYAQPAAQPAAPRQPKSAGLKRGLLFGGIGAGVVALLVVGAVVLVSVLGGSSSGGGSVTVATIRDEPKDDAWVIEHPLLEDGDDGSLNTYSATVGQDRALVVFSNDADSLLSLVDTKSGVVLWTTDLDGENMSVLSAVGTTPYVISYADDDDTVIAAIDPGNGEIINDTSSLDGVTLVATGDTAPIGNDLLLQSDDGIGRYSAAALDDEKWVVDTSDDDHASVAGNKLVVGSDAYSLDSGEEVDWDGDDDMFFSTIEDRIVGFAIDGDSYTIGVYSDSGEELWANKLDKGVVPFTATGDIYLIASDSELLALDLSSGEELWSIDAELAGYGMPVDPSVGVVFVPISGDEDEVTAIDITSGEELYTLDVADDGDWIMSIVGASDDVAYLSGNEDAELIAIDIRTGDELWTMENPGGSNWYSFAVLGGNLVAYISGLDADSLEQEPALRGLQP